MIQIKNLTKQFSNNQTLFEGLNLTVNDGDNIAIIGLQAVVKVQFYDTSLVLSCQIPGIFLLMGNTSIA